MKCLLFDLDGTLSNPLEGIWSSFNYGLESLGYHSHAKETIARYIGPPLDETFPVLTGSTSNQETAEFIARYQEHYAVSGYCQNKMYPGIREVLKASSDQGFRLGLCTYKREEFASKILSLFDISHYFSFVSGGTIGSTKAEQIKGLLSEKIIDRHTIMIGDRAGDLQAAHLNGLESAGVLWGYGSRVELEAESPKYLFSEPTELTQMVLHR